jgi:hypothetical protein
VISLFPWEFSPAQRQQIKTDRPRCRRYFFYRHGRPDFQIGVSDLGGLTGAIALNLEAPIVELPLVNSLQKNFMTKELFYTAKPGQVILLQSSLDGSNWKNVQQTLPQMKLLTKNTQFMVPALFNGKPLSYRAIVVDTLSENYFR